MILRFTMTEIMASKIAENSEPNICSLILRNVIETFLACLSEHP